MSKKMKSHALCVKILHEESNSCVRSSKHDRDPQVNSIAMIHHLIN